MKWLVALNEGICWCKCERGVAGVPGAGQADCPWCGCGWMLSCLSCHRAFTHARVEEVGVRPDELAMGYLSGTLERELQASDAERVLMLAEIVERLSESLVVGGEYVVLDGEVFPVDAGPVAFSGIYRHHQLAELPHKTFRRNPDDLVRFLDKPYWSQGVKWRENPRRSGSPPPAPIKT